METAQKLKILKESASYDVCSSCNPRSEQGAFRNQAFSHLGGIYQASTSHGCSSLYKILMSNKCVHSCGYCINNKSTDIPRAALSPEELARTFINLYSRKMVQGLFLSSAIEDTAEKTMARMIAAVELVRFRYHFKGFIHLKILPGASEATIRQACRLANRASINIEAPSADRLSRIARTKNFAKDILPTIAAISREEGHGRLSAGQTTQFIVGAAGECDQEILQTSENLYRSHHLRRIYFSAFTPIEGTPLENSRRTTPQREHRLYQCDFLMRDYQFQSSDFVLQPTGSLPLDIDPKLNYAHNHPELFPIEINTAPVATLLKIPGIGPLSAKRIATTRQFRKLRELPELKRLGVIAKRAAPFVLLNGKKAAEKPLLARQLQLALSI